MLITDINVCSMAFHSGAIAFVLQAFSDGASCMLIGWMIDVACQDSIMAMSLL